MLRYVVRMYVLAALAGMTVHACLSIVPTPTL